ncbi:MAG: hypothetical protein AMJ92_05505 [candidate division Zixibacteria bacterium SM23_81]|nr:MAG: hypothetical protein AMJ92_05505 [candidate division Zixibacteria bacterium SM23_81]
MKIETKTYIIIVVTLVIGMVIGSLITGAVLRHRVRRFVNLRHPEHLTTRIEELIGPDESQREAVHEILMKHSEQFLEIHSHFESEMLALRDSLRKDLDPILTDGQKKRLERQPKPPKYLRGRRPGPSRWREPGHQPPPSEPGPPPPPPPERDEG